MKKFTMTAIIILSIGLAMILTGSVLQGITWRGTFDGQHISAALVDVGYITAMLSGIVLAGLGVSTAVRIDEKEKK